MTNYSNKNDKLSELEEQSYQKTLNLLNSNFESTSNDNQEVLQVLKDIFNELTDLSSDETGSLNQEKIDNNFGELNFNTLFGQATHVQLLDLFHSLCSQILIETYKKIQPLFYFISGALLYSRKNEKIKISWSNLVEYLNLDVLNRSYQVRFDFPEDIRNKLSTYLLSLPEFNFEDNQQNDITYEEHFLLTSKLKNAFYFSTLQDIPENVMNIIEKISVDNNTTQNSIVKYINSICYDGLSNQDQNEEINSLLSEFKNQSIYNKCGQVLYDLTDAIIRKNKDEFFKATNEYLIIYWEITKTTPNKDTPEFDLSKVTLEDKIIAFFTNFYENISMNGEPFSNCFMELMLDFYDPDIFNSFMEKYSIPYNACIRKENIVKKENEEEIITQQYFSLFELALAQRCFEIANDLIDKPEALEPFYLKVIEGTSVYEYNYQPFSDLTYIDEGSILYLIEKNIFNQDTILPIEQSKEMTILTDIFYFLLNSGYEQAFFKLYTKCKTENPDFDLKTYQIPSTLLCLYLSLLKTDDRELVNPAMLSIFVQENYSLYQKNDNNLNAVDLIKLLPLKIAVHTTALLEPLFKNQTPIVTEDVDLKLIQGIDQNISWFNRANLEEHFKRLSKDKDGVNAEYIKTMLSNNNNLRKNLLIQDESFFDTLNLKFPNFHEVIKFYKGQFRLKKLTGKIHIPPILLLGEPGIGKTHFAKEFAQFLNTGYTFLDMGSITANWLLTGNNGTWKGAKQGKILEAVMKSKTVNPIILMDELDKARGGEHDPTIALYQLLEEVNSREFTDEFIDFSFDASGIMYISCANTIQNISEPLLSRFKVFKIEKPTDSQLDAIIHNIYTDSTKNSHIFVENLDEELVNKLKAFSLRAIKVIIEDGISNSLLELSPEAIQEKLANAEKISLNTNHIKNPQKKTSIGFNKV